MMFPRRRQQQQSQATPTDGGGLGGISSSETIMTPSSPIIRNRGTGGMSSNSFTNNTKSSPRAAGSSHHHHGQQQQSQSAWSGMMLLIAAIVIGYYLPVVFFGFDGPMTGGRYYGRVAYDPAFSMPYKYDKKAAKSGPKVFDGVQARVYTKQYDYYTSSDQTMCYKHENTNNNGIEEEDDPMSDTYHDRPATVGYLYQRILKASSTTAASVNVRLALNAADRVFHDYSKSKINDQHHKRSTSTRKTPQDADGIAAAAANAKDRICQYRVGFGMDPIVPMGRRYTNRDVTHSFLWTTLRHPNARYTSYFFHQEVSRRTAHPHDKVFQTFLNGLPAFDYYINALSTTSKFGSYDLTMQTYDHLRKIDTLVGTGLEDETTDEQQQQHQQQKPRQLVGQQQQQQQQPQQQQQDQVIPQNAQPGDNNDNKPNIDVSTTMVRGGGTSVSTFVRRIMGLIRPIPGEDKIIKDTDINRSYPRKIPESWLRDNPNKGKRNIPRPLLKAGAIAWVWKEGTRPDVFATTQENRNNGNSGATTKTNGVEHQQQVQQHRRLTTADADDARVQLANKIMKEYDFIAITERFEESMVVLMMLLDIPMADILHLPFKQSPGFDDGMNGQCYFMWKPFVTSGMAQFFDSEPWKERVRYDMALYNAANRSLDLTIQKLGVRKFEKHMSRFLFAQRMVKERCWGRVLFPCDAGGKLNEKTDCWHKDTGCGNECLDRVATELNLW